VPIKVTSDLALAVPVSSAAVADTAMVVILAEIFDNNDQQ